MCRIRGRAREYGLDRRVGAGGWEVVRDKATGVSGSLSMKNSINQVTGLGSYPQRGVLPTFKRTRDKSRLGLL